MGCGASLGHSGRRWAEGVLLYSRQLQYVDDVGLAVESTHEVTVGQLCPPLREACQVELAFGQGPQRETSPFKVSGPLKPSLLPS